MAITNLTPKTIEAVLGEKCENMQFYVFDNIPGIKPGFNTDFYNGWQMPGPINALSEHYLALIKTRMERHPDFGGRTLAAMAVKTIGTNRVTPWDNFGCFIQHAPYAPTPYVIGNIIAFNPRIKMYESHVGGWLAVAHNFKSVRKAAQAGFSVFASDVALMDYFFEKYMAPYGDQSR